MAGVKGRSGGHNRTPDSVKRLRGTFRKDRAHGEPDEAPTRAPAKPAWIAADPVASEAWDRIILAMTNNRTIRSTDQDAVLLAAKAQSEYRAADAIVQSAGLTVATENGINAHPAVRIRESAWRRWSSALTSLGLQPLGRERVAKTQAPQHKQSGNKFVDV